jgi:predicted MFS family arabinose efflux permease
VSDSVGRRRALVAGTTLFTVGGLAAASAPTLELLLVARDGAQFQAIAIPEDIFSEMKV